MMLLVVDRCGCIRCVYGESVPLASLGPLSIKRGSHVEPRIDGKWTADLSPVNGPTLGPFNLRSDALAAELDWLERNWLLPVDGQ
jgi:hypothetical protein